MTERSRARRVYEQAMGTALVSWPYLLVFQAVVASLVWNGLSMQGGRRIALLVAAVVGELWLLRHAVRRLRAERPAART